jgi:hypothetical protein
LVRVGRPHRLPHRSLRSLQLLRAARSSPLMHSALHPAIFASAPIASVASNGAAWAYSRRAARSARQAVARKATRGSRPARSRRCTLVHARLPAALASRNPRPLQQQPPHARIHIRTLRRRVLPQLAELVHTCVCACAVGAVWGEGLIVTHSDS